MSIPIRLKKLTLENITNRPVFYRLAFRYYCYLKKDVVPPPMFNFVGGERFEEIGRGYFNYIIEFTNFHPEGAILDIGCGIGRVALPLTEYINDQGSYAGFDIVDIGPRWCQHKISRYFPNFQFQHADIHNREYNPKGKIKAAEYIFPYSDNTFDVVFASSVFTHMFPDAVSNYVRQLARVLRIGGTAMCTFFVLDDEAETMMATSDFPFKSVEGQNYRVMVPLNPENAIAYPVEDVRAFFADHGLEIVEPILYGSWSGRKAVVGGQDIVVVRKVSEG